MKLKLEHKEILLYSAALIALFFAVSSFLAYGTRLRDPLTVSFKRLYPAAFAGSHVLSINDIEEGSIIGARFGLDAAKATSDQYEKQQASALAEKLGLKVDNNDLANEMLFLTKGKNEEYVKVLARYYGGSERLFYKYAVFPQAIDAKLRMKYNSDIRTTDPAYAKAQDAIERIGKGEKFEDIAKSESQDKATGQLGGDLGFYEIGQVIPELEDQAGISELGEVRNDVVITRLGYHVVYPVEYSTSNGKKLWHMKHILYVPTGYDQWLANSLKAVKIIKIKK